MTIIGLEEVPGVELKEIKENIKNAKYEDKDLGIC